MGYNGIRPSYDGRAENDGRGIGAPEGEGGGGRGFGGLGGGPGGTCTCANCSHAVEHQQGEPCSILVCPNCGVLMARR